ncbi:DNAJ-like 20, DNA J protein C26 [Hibiscus trionum]|uniref:DNAJ-like 20, DNA J protein C26 n=1 Tax=Hibiscus trionum TaxID=183268 RepID=A0A9W7I0A9_HIBTR|nr:DNAJ-like 20, DNA J protein C26 [Hibiscus trionum]
MEISLQMNLNTSKLSMVSTTSKSRSRCRPKAYKVQVISCRGRADNLCVPRSNTDFYRVLRLDHAQNVGLDDIKKAYRSLVLQYHPDVCPPSSKDEYTKRFLELQMAYETLSDPISRKMYDCEFGFGNCWMGERRSKFPRDVWEQQLDGLKKRSHARMVGEDE